MDIVSEQNIYPAKGYLLLEIPDKPSQTVSGVMVASTDGDSTPMMGVILRVGDTKSQYKVGQTVLFRRYSIDEIKIKDGEGEKKFYLLEIDNVLSVIK